MGDVLSTSVSGLLAFQQALDVTSNNIANSATPGYSVENVNFTPAPGQATASGYVGNGVDVQSITRTYSELLAGQVRASQASYSSANTLATQAGQVDDLLSDSSTGLTATVQSFSNALQTLANSPTSTASQQALLSEAQALTQQLTSYSSQVSQYGSDLEQQIGSDVTQVNSIASSIASLNSQITADESGTSQTPNELMDQRDELVNQLSQLVSVNTVTQANGSMDVYIGSGQALVLGDTTQQLTTLPNQYNSSVLDIGLSAGNSTSDITSEITGGELGGLLTTRTQVIDPTQNALGQLSVGLATIMNQQQAAGMDATGAQGQPMFAVGGVQVLPSANNTGDASVSATRTDLADLTTDDYTLQYTNGNWQLQDATTGQTVSMTGAGTAADPFQAAGLSIVVGSGTPADGDGYLIQPTAAATSGLQLLLSSPAQIASASLAQSAVGTANTGSGSISTPTITDPSEWVPDTYTITFSTATQYQVTNGGGTVVDSGTYSSGSPIDFEGAQVSISGVPAANDTFTVSPNVAGSSDNSNLQAAIAALSAPSLNGGTASLSGAANALVSQVGVLTQQAQANASAQQQVNQDATTSLSNLSGVNLDEEAANMVQYQQAYQAMAELIQTSGQMFTSLMTAITDG